MTLHEELEPNWLLCLHFFILALLSATLDHILKPLWYILCKSLPEERPLRDEMHTIRSQQQALSIKDDFAAHSKLQRKLNKLEDQLKSVVQTRLERNVKLKYAIQYSIQAALTVLMLVSVIYFRKEPLIILKQNLSPFENLFSYPSGVPHAIAPHAWVLISRLSCNTVVKAISKINTAKDANKE